MGDVMTDVALRDVSSLIHEAARRAERAGCGELGLRLRLEADAVWSLTKCPSSDLEGRRVVLSWSG